MEDRLIYKIDLTKKDIYLKQYTRKYFLRNGIFLGIPVIIMLIAAFNAKEKYVIGVLFFPIILFSSTFFFGKCRQLLYLTHYLKSEFYLTNDSLILLINGYQKKKMTLNYPITVKTTLSGTYILRGDFNWASFHLSKTPPTKMPTRIDDIFIPSITENYSDLLERINKLVKQNN